MPSKNHVVISTLRPMSTKVLLVLTLLELLHIFQGVSVYLKSLWEEWECLRKQAINKNRVVISTPKLTSIRVLSELTQLERLLISPVELVYHRFPWEEEWECSENINLNKPHGPLKLISIMALLDLTLLWDKPTTLGELQEWEWIKCANRHPGPQKLISIMDLLDLTLLWDKPTTPGELQEWEWINSEANSKISNPKLIFITDLSVPILLLDKRISLKELSEAFQSLVLTPDSPQEEENKDPKPTIFMDPWTLIPL